MSRGSKAPAPPASKARAWGPSHPKPGHVLHEEHAQQVLARRAARHAVIAQARAEGHGQLVRETPHADGKASTFYWQDGTFSIASLPIVEG